MIKSGRMISGYLSCRQGGVALILVIWMMVILTALVTEFTYSMRTEVNIVRNFKEEEEAYQLALGGIEQAKMELLSVQNENEVYVNGEGVLIVGVDNTEPQRTTELNKGRFTYTIMDEEGKLNLNSITDTQLSKVLEDSGVPSEELDVIVDSVMDWRDTNDLHRLNGAEEDYYRSLDLPYSSSDGLFQAVEELLMVKGMTNDILLGVKSESIDETEVEDAEETLRGIIDILTVFGTRGINVNTASREVLEAVLGPADADNILMQRETGPVTAAVRGGKLTSAYFSIISIGENQDGSIKRTVKTIVNKKGGKLKHVYWNDNVIG
ncbi:MAG: general secretion pathway protein GspK [Nitrospira sp.]|nr:general secretion pathway protein GspK [bacterium]MBL7049775.1 general secretion pathway protein GspK [Nitrospira sp.]